MALAVLVFCRRRRGDQRGVDYGPFAHHQALLGEVTVDCVEDLACEPFGFEQVAELQQGPGVRCRPALQINADKSANGLAVVITSSMPSSDKPKHCWATYMRNMSKSDFVSWRKRPSLPPELVATV